MSPSTLYEAYYLTSLTDRFKLLIFNFFIIVRIKTLRVVNLYDQFITYIIYIYMYTHIVKVLNGVTVTILR